MIVYNIFYPRGYISPTIIIYSCMFLISSVVPDLVESILFGQKNMVPSSIINGVSSLLYFILVAMVMRSNITIEKLIFILVVVQIAKTICFMIVAIINKYTVFRVKHKSIVYSDIARLILASSWPYFF